MQGYRGQTDVSGNVVYVTLSSGDIMMINAQTGKLVRDYYIGAPMDVGVSIGAVGQRAGVHSSSQSGRAASRPYRRVLEQRQETSWP